MTKLAFVIPTWKRPDHLIRCVDSIAAQIGGREDIKIHIVQDGEEEAVNLAIASCFEKWGRMIRLTEHQHSDYAAAFRAMFRAEPEVEWVWTFGDDDVLRPQALAFMLGQLEGQQADFLHVCELKRASGVNKIHVADTLLSLCVAFGWIEMTGFITGNITRGALLAKAADTVLWPSYAKTAFVQSCALLEALRDRPATFFDVPLIDSQEPEQTTATAETWRDQNIPGRYLFVSDAIELMMDQGMLPPKLPAKFFRYLSYHLWDRFVVSFTNDYLNHGMLWGEDAWARVAKFAALVEEPEQAEQLTRDINAARGLSMLGQYMLTNVEGLKVELAAINQRRGTAVYPYSFVERAKAAETSVAVLDQQGSDRTEASPAG